MSNLERYNNVFVKVFNVQEADLNAGFTFKDIDTWDSLAHVTLISELEDEFEIVFAPEEILNYESYENGKSILKKYDVNFSN